MSYPEKRIMTINADQEECLSTCMGSCENICYPSLEIVEEAGEYFEKLMDIVEWTPGYLGENELKEAITKFIEASKIIGKHGKLLRHQDPDNLIVPFKTRKFNDFEEWESKMPAVWLEIADIQWGCHVAAYIFGVRSQMLCDMRHEKLLKRKKEGTIDGKGDTKRTKITAPEQENKEK